MAWYQPFRFEWVNVVILIPKDTYTRVYPLAYRGISDNENQTGVCGGDINTHGDVNSETGREESRAELAGNRKQGGTNSIVNLVHLNCVPTSHLPGNP